MVVNGRRFNPGQRPDAPHEFGEEIGDRFAARIFRDRQRDFHREDVARIETRIHVLQTNEALQQQTRTDEQDERERDFRDDQHVTHAIATHTAGRTAAAFL